ncbi:MAG: radical SAM protein [Euryarchaeota archaeon]|nr:radical SAM protein [Euryarchaeota archaeon]
MAAVLEQEGHKCFIFDQYSTGAEDGELLDAARRFKPDLIGISAVTPMIKTAHRQTGMLKEALGKDIPVAVGGPHVSSSAEAALQEFPRFDIAAPNEGEFAMRDLARALEEGRPLEGVRGIVYRENSHIVRNPPQDLIEPLDVLPFPAWHLLPMHLYYPTSPTIYYRGGRKTMGIFSTRGCPAFCRFCDSHSIWTRKYRKRSGKNVVDEMEALKEKYKIGHIYFLDDTFHVDKKRTLDFCNELIERDLDMTFECYGRADFTDLMTDDIMRKMKQAGLKLMWFGLETGSQETLDHMRKGISLEQAERSVRRVRECGILAGAFWIIGFPNETEAHVRQTFEFYRRLPLSWHDTFSILTPYPGTEYYWILKEEGLTLHEDWERYYNRHMPGLLPPVRTKHLGPEELVRLKNEGDRMAWEYNLTDHFHYYLKHPHHLARNFTKNPRAFMTYPGLFVKLKWERFLNRAFKVPLPAEPVGM